jgi:hypothetical protein
LEQQNSYLLDTAELFNGFEDDLSGELDTQCEYFFQDAFDFDELTNCINMAV